MRHRSMILVVTLVALFAIPSPALAQTGAQAPRAREAGVTNR